MPEMYENYELFIPVDGASYLALNGSNFMQVNIQAPSGNSDSPGFSFRNYEKLGMYVEDQNTIGLTDGWKMFLFADKTISYLNRLGFKFDIKVPQISSNKTVTFPNNTGTVALVEDTQFVKTNNESVDTIYAGMVVKLDSTTGIKKALADVPGNLGIGLAVSTGAITTSISVASYGLFTLADWTDVIGSASLTVGTKYYLSDAVSGTLGTSPGTETQLVGIAITGTQLLLKI